MNRQTIFKLFSVFLLPFLTIFLFESILNITGYKSAYEKEDPFLGFQGVYPVYELKSPAGSDEVQKYVTRKSKLSYFNYQEFPAEIKPDAFRIFSFGGSTTYGRPYTGETAFPRWLEINLQALDSTKDYEVINVGGISYASYRIVNLMEEMVRYKPDIFIVYTGHNEFLEDRTYAKFKEEPFLVTWFRGNLNRLKTYSLLRTLWLRVKEKERIRAENKFKMTGEVKAILDQSFGLNWYHRDLERNKAIILHFRLNSEKMIDIAQYHDIPIIFIVPPSNEKDFAPFKSEFDQELESAEKTVWEGNYRAGLNYLKNARYAEALVAFKAAAHIDSMHAELRYRIGECFYGLGQYQAAKTAFVMARDLDVVPLRATSQIQSIVREVCSQRGVPLLDLVQILEKRNRQLYGYTILGDETFLDHDHLTIETHQLVSELLVKLMSENGMVKATRAWDEIPRDSLYNSSMASIDSSYYGQLELNLAKVLGWAGKIDEAAPFIERAARSLPNNPDAQHGLGLLYIMQDKFEEAREVFHRALDIDSTYAAAYNSLGTIYDRYDDLDQALYYYYQAVKYNPSNDEAYFNIGGILYEKGQILEAINAYIKAVDSNPRHIYALNDLGATYMELNNTVKAVEAFERIISIEPKYHYAYNNLGMIYFKEEDYLKSRQMFQRSLEVKPGNEFALHWMSILNSQAK